MNARTSWSPNADAASSDAPAEAAANVRADDAGAHGADPLDALMDARFDESGRLVQGGGARNIEVDELQRAVEQLARRVERANARGMPGRARDQRDPYDDPYEQHGRSLRPYRGSRRADDTLQLLDRLEERLGVRGSGRHGGWDDDYPRGRMAPDFDRQFAALESRIEQLAELAASPASEDIRADIAALGQQLDGMSRSESVVSGRMGAIQRQLAELREKFDEAGGPDIDRLAVVEERLEQIGAAIAGQQLAPESLTAVEHGYNHILERIAKIERLTELAVPPDEVWERIDNLREALGQLPTLDNLSVVESRILVLNDRLEELANAGAHPGDLVNLDSRLTDLIAAIAEMRDRPAFDPADIHAGLEALVDRIETLRGQNRAVDLSVVEGRLEEIGDLARRAAESDYGAALWKIEERLESLAERVETIGGEARPVDLAGVEGRLDDLAGVVGRIAESDKGGALWKIEERLDDLTYNISEQDKRLAGQDLTTLRDSLEALHMRVGALADQQGSEGEGPALAAKLEAIGHRLDSMGGGLTRADIAPIAARMSTIETGIRSVATDQAANLAPIQDRIDEIANALSRERDPLGIDARFSAIQDRLDAGAGGGAGLSDLDGKLDLLNAALRNAEELAGLEDVSELRADIAALRRELRSMPAGLSGGDGAEGSAALVSILHEITDRLDRLPEEPPVTYRDLDSQFGRFMRRVDEQEAEALAGIEGRLANIQSMLSSGSPIAIDAAMPDNDRSGDTVAHIVTRVAGALSTDLGILKDAAAATEHNTRRALEAVHETLEAVVKRMAYLERDAGHDGWEHDAATAPRAPAPARTRTPAPQPAPVAPAPVEPAPEEPVVAARPEPRTRPDVEPQPQPEPDYDPLPADDDDLDRAVSDAIATLAIDRGAPDSRPEDEVSIPEITLSDQVAEEDGTTATPPAVSDDDLDPMTFESLLDQHRPTAQIEDEVSGAPQRGGASLLGRLTPSQLLRRATGGKADSFSPGSDDADDPTDTPLEPGTDAPMSSSLEGAPSSNTESMSGDRPGRTAKDAKVEPDPALVGAGGAAGNGNGNGNGNGKAPHPADEFLMAARRAAQAAAAEAVRAEYDAGLVGDGTAISRVVTRLNARRRLVLASAVAIAVAFAALQFVKMRLVNAPNPSPAPIEMSADVPQPAMGSDSQTVMGAMDDDEAEGAGSDTAMLTAPAMQQGDDAAPGMVRPDESIAFSSPEAPGVLTKPAMKAGADEEEAADDASDDAIMSMDAEDGVDDSGDGADGNDAVMAAAPASMTPSAAAASPAVLDGSVFPALPEPIGPERLRQEAATGDPAAMFEIASRYAEGRHVTQDLEAAANWYERAAEAGLAPAQYRLGSLYEKGQGVTRNVRAAEAWYRRAAVAGNAKAMHNLAVLYAEGAGGNQDLKAAAGWFRRAAELGIRDSQFNIAILHARGLGVRENLVEAYKWFAVAAASGDQQAAERRDTVAAALGRKNLAKAKAAFEAFQPAPMEPAANLVVRPDDNWGQTDPQKISQNMKDLILRTQKLLSASGYDVGLPDGVFGPRTREAIAAFQTDIGMQASGRVDTRLLAALEARAI